MSDLSELQRVNMMQHLQTPTMPMGQPASIDAPTAASQEQASHLLHLQHWKEMRLASLTNPPTDFIAMFHEHSHWL